MNKTTSQGLAAIGLVASTAAAGKLYNWLTESKHDRTLKKAGKKLEAGTSDEVTIRADHGVDVGDGTPRKLNGKVPDLTLTHFASSTFIAFEVETADSLDGHAKSQLEAFNRKDNYEAVLVVPSSALQEAHEFVREKVFADVTVTTPPNVVDDVL